MDSRKWYWQRNGQVVGPLSSGQLRQLADKGQLHPVDLIHHEGARQWVPASSVKGLFNLPASNARPLWPWIAACAATALLGGGIVAVVMNQGKKADESRQVGASK